MLVADFDLLAESMTAPPVAHVIFSRSKDKLITFQCLVQTLLSEWKKLKPWCAVCIILLAAVAEYLTSDTISKFSFISWTCLSTLSETIIVFWLYPMGRLIEDITFHFGLPPTKLRVWSFVVLPIFYSYIRSQAPREVSSYITEKIEKTSYKLDIIYEESRQGLTFEDVKLY
ncbi:uncharacterized protein LOC116770150 [Danaus plexippus]|uniref:uncharacterized protein LOC116770150 n=1 Tax=Danaus plexippus TaxID=13037 RepID=UPI002AB09973|nr:uncharacterized protein LOC116770150 [Danaus plexippus]